MILCTLTAFFLMSCTKPYNPKVIASANNYLVVEGTINTGGDSTMIKLSRTVNLSAGTTINPELNASLMILDDQNQSYTLKSIGNGFYTSAILNLDNTRKYRLSITTSDGKIYQSDYVAPITTPAIDSVGFAVKSNGVQIYLNTHDPNNNTHYYHWDYVETWEFHARYQSQYISNGVNDMVLRTPAQSVYQCYGNSISTNILLGSSAKLAQDVIYQAPISLIAPNSEKLETKYSILVKQYAMASDSYNYYQLLKSNTEQLGSIFDAQPSQLTGNIHCTTDATLPVIGYITANTIQQKRIYISNSQIPSSWIAKYPYDCELDSILYVHPITGNNDVLEFLVPVPNPFGLLAVGPIPSLAGPKPIGYTATDADCADCTIRGTVTKPNFWQ
jgi:hypothetical protein